MKRILAMILLLILLFTLISCKRVNDGEVDSSEQQTVSSDTATSSEITSSETVSNEDKPANTSNISSSANSSYVLKKMRRGDYNRVLIISTGALISTISPFQGESIPGIAHAVALECEK